MRIERKRYVVMRRNRTEVWCSSWDRDFEVVPVIEMIATEEALKDGKSD